MRWFFSIAIGWVALGVGTADAQFWPTFTSHAYYSDFGAYPYAAGMGGVGVNRQIASETHLAGQRQAAAQDYAIQSGIRNTLTEQAQERTQAALSQRQSDRNWWMQVQSQQMAERRSAGPAVAAVGPSVPVARDDVIQWPEFLQAPDFAAQRDRIEEPYLRDPKGLSKPTLEDYRTMIDAVEKMRGIAAQKVAYNYSLPPGQFSGALEFLKRLGDEARRHIEELEAAPNAKPARAK